MQREEGLRDGPVVAIVYRVTSIELNDGNTVCNQLLELVGQTNPFNYRNGKRVCGCCDFWNFVL
jgi:hypothetical protein